MRKIGLTGGSGFIGGHVIDELRDRGYTVVVFDRHQHTLHRDDVELFIGDMRDEVDMTEFAAHVDGIIHLAGVLGTQETVFNPRPAAESNLRGGLNFLEAITQYKLPGVYIAVGNWWMNNPYSISKNMVERFCHMYQQERATKVNVVRAVNAYGPRQVPYTPFGSSKVRKITPSLVCRALCGLPMELYGGGTQVSDMVYVRDVAKALVNALEYADQDSIIDHAIEVGPTKHQTIRQVAELVNDIVADLGYKPVPIDSLPMRPGEKAGDKVTADSSTLVDIGLRPQDLTPLTTGMTETIDWYVEQQGRAWHKP